MNRLAASILLALVVVAASEFDGDIIEGSDALFNGRHCIKLKLCSNPRGPCHFDIYCPHGDEEYTHVGKIEASENKMCCSLHHWSVHCHSCPKEEDAQESANIEDVADNRICCVFYPHGPMVCRGCPNGDGKGQEAANIEDVADNRVCCTIYKGRTTFRACEPHKRLSCSYYKGVSKCHSCAYSRKMLNVEGRINLGPQS